MFNNIYFILFYLKVFRLIDRRLQTGVHGVRHLFRSNDPNQEGKLSKYKNKNEINEFSRNYILEKHFEEY